MDREKNIIVTGITPTGDLTIGNYLGSIKTLVEMQKEYQLIIFSANLHSITQISGDKPLRFSKDELIKKTRDIIAIYAACGVDIENNICFIQSDVQEHSELAYILTCGTTIGLLSRMTQYKDKTLKNANKLSIPTGLLVYPCLMAADILLYSPKYVPIGKDQKQHIELCRDIATFFNNNYEKMFTLPEPIINKTYFKICSLTEPTKKMSKSSSDKYSYISLFDSKEEIRKKISKSKTDSENSVYYDYEKKPGISNLLTIYSGITNKSIKELEIYFKNKNYKEFKEELIVKLNIFLANIQMKYKNIIGDEERFNKILKFNANKAKIIASKKIVEVKKKIGLYE